MPNSFQEPPPQDSSGNYSDMATGNERSTISASARQRAEAFLAVSDQFRLGELDTESCHPFTQDLSRWAKEDPVRALAALRQVDVAALQQAGASASRLEHLAEAMGETLRAGGRIFLCGCGATGRLALSLEYLCRATPLLPYAGWRASVVGFMAGGDAALIRSIEKFEDHPEYGARQLRELGFGEGDLLLGITEGGETPFVIGATLLAAEESHRAPFFLYCNPDSQLIKAAARSAQVLADERIRKINLSCGPMALAGSTRMQASTVLMLAVGLALMYADCPRKAPAGIAVFEKWIQEKSWDFLAPFVEHEAAVYGRGGRVLYRCREHAITVLTDTTERSPTFSLPVFENFSSAQEPPALCYLEVAGSGSAEEAWQVLLGREPRALEWEGLSQVTGLRRLLGYDISGDCLRRREVSTQGAPHDLFSIGKEEDALCLRLGPLEARVLLEGRPVLFEHLLLKVLLNAHSTALMGRLGRYEGNLMTYVRPSNHKLIDRAARYAGALLRRDGMAFSYEEIVLAVFHEAEVMGPDEPVVLRVLRRLKAV